MSTPLFSNLQSYAASYRGAGFDAAPDGPRDAAMLAVTQLPAPEPTASVIYKSAGRTLVIGSQGAAERAADLLGRALVTTLFVENLGEPGGQGAKGGQRYPTLGGQIWHLTGYLGAFELQWLPRSADERVQPAELVTESFDLLLDLRANPAFGQHALPQGYFWVPPALAIAGPGEASASRSTDLPTAVRKMRALVGEFDKPKFFDYRQKLCAHSRNDIVGCSACIEVCSAAAIRSDRRGQQVVVNPHLCVGCGACSTVCPTGAMRFVYPTASDQGVMLKTLLATFASNGGQKAAVLLHSQDAGTLLLEELAGLHPPRSELQKGLHALPARVLPLPLWHSASVGLDVWLTVLAYGASQVWVLMTGDEAPQYVDAVRGQMAVAQAVLTGLGYKGQHLRLIQTSDAAVLAHELQAVPAQGVPTCASFAVQTDKRATLELALAHLIAHAPLVQLGDVADQAADSAPADTVTDKAAADLPPAITLPAAGSPLGGLLVNAQTCTLCLGCVSACPAGALAGSPDAMQLRFTERACVQCGLCVQTCPEKALSLLPQLNLSSQRIQPALLVAAESYFCVRCGQPFGTRKAVELMLGKLGKHPMFQGAALERLKMCGDCRVQDVHAAQPVNTRP
jgi:ferredoxin